MASDTRTTVDHEEIRSWVEQHGGSPAAVRTTSDDDPGILRIDFPGGAGEEDLRPIDWDTWFEKFEQKDLAFVYQDEKASGEDSTFFRLTDR